jgi:hypothetical protein
MQRFRQRVRRARTVLRRRGLSWTQAAPGDKIGALVGAIGALIGVGVGFVGLILAVLGLVLALQQRNIAVQQTDMAVAQGRIAERQAQIAEQQHKYFEEQRNKVASLELKFYTTPEMDGEREVLLVGVKNNGKASARGFYWRLHVPTEWNDWIELKAVDCPLMAPQRAVLDATDVYILNGGHVDAPVYPGMVMVCAKLFVAPDLMRLQLDSSDDRFRWYIVADDGRFPPDGVNDLHINNPSFPGPSDLDPSERQ